jgi:gluconolactonase
MKRRWLLTVVFLGCAAALCSALLQWPKPARPWYFDEEQCQARLLGKTPQQVEAAVGSRPDYFGRPWREHTELDESLWGPGIAARMAWHFEWGAITVEYNAQERSVFADVWRYQPTVGERDRITGSLPEGRSQHLSELNAEADCSGGPAKELIFEPGARLKVEAGGGAGGEGPAWDPKLGVLTSGNGHIYQLTRDGTSRIYRKGAGTNGLLFDHQGRLLACEPLRRRVTRTEPDGKLTILTERYGGRRYNQPNDLTVDSQGRIYFSDPQYGDRKGMEMLDAQGRTVEGVYRIDPDGKVTRILGRELERPNGLLVSVDDRFLYVADNNNNTVGGARKLYRFDMRNDGTVDVGSRKLLYDWGTGRGPDGVKQDRKGRLYVAAGLNRPNPPFEPAPDKKGGIYVLSPEGKLLTFLPVPTDEVTNCAFGGEDLRTLYITAGGTLYSIRTTTPGRVVWPPVEGAKE